MLVRWRFWPNDATIRLRSTRMLSSRSSRFLAPTILAYPIRLDNTIPRMSLCTSKFYRMSSTRKFRMIIDIFVIREAFPDAVVYPENVEQISKLVVLCNKNKIPVIPYGAGSGFEGGINAIKVILLVFFSSKLFK